MLQLIFQCYTPSAFTMDALCPLPYICHFPIDAILPSGYCAH